MDEADGRITLVRPPFEKLILDFPAVEAWMQNYNYNVDILTTNARMRRETGEKYKNALIQVYYAKGVTEIKLTVYDANGNNQNAVINEIRVPS